MRCIFLVILEIILISSFNINISLAKEEKEVDKGTNFSSSFFQYKSEERRDPFVSLLSKKRVYKSSKPNKLAVSPKILLNSKYKLVGLVGDEKGILAIIQEEKKIWIVKRGDIIKNFVISEIKRDTGEVILIGKDGVIKLKIGR